MKVFDLQCAQAHVFEGWFGSEEDFQNQLARRLLTCPVCNDADIQRRPSAARLNLGASTHAATERPANGEPLSPQQVQALWMAAVRQLMANTEDVGDRFAEEARRMHHGEAPERGIRGQTTAEEARALREEGIDVVRLVVPDFAKEPLQ